MSTLQTGWLVDGARVEYMRRAWEPQRGSCRRTLNRRVDQTRTDADHAAPGIDGSALRRCSYPQGRRRLSNAVRVPV